MQADSEIETSLGTVLILNKSAAIPPDFTLLTPNQCNCIK